jgi:hypothetical protein
MHWGKFLFAIAIGLLALALGLLFILRAPAIARFITDQPTAGRIVAIRGAGCIGVVIGVFAFATAAFY